MILRTSSNQIQLNFGYIINTFLPILLYTQSS